MTVKSLCLFIAKSVVRDLDTMIELQLAADLQEDSVVFR